MARNARFWVRYADDWVKLTLRPGQSAALSEGGPTDEGWQRDTEEYTHEGDVVQLEWFSSGVDCDGRLDMGGSAYCPLSDLQSREAYPPKQGVRLPEWVKGNRWQRDHSAEAMGY